MDARHGTVSLCFVIVNVKIDVFSVISVSHSVSHSVNRSRSVSNDVPATALPYYTVFGWLYRQIYGIRQTFQSRLIYV